MTLKDLTPENVEIKQGLKDGRMVFLIRVHGCPIDWELAEFLSMLFKNSAFVFYVSKMRQMRKAYDKFKAKSMKIHAIWYEGKIDSMIEKMKININAKEFKNEKR